MEYGAQNQLLGTVSEIIRGDVMCHVKLKVAGGADMSSVMTVDSLDQLQIRPGDKVRVVVKAVNVLLVKE